MFPKFKNQAGMPMYTNDSESHALMTRLLGGEKEQLTKNIAVYISSGSITDEMSFPKIQTHNRAVSNPW